MDIPTVKLFSGFSFPPNFSNSTWFIIVFVLGMFLLSCMSNRREMFEDPIVRYKNVHFGDEYSTDYVNHQGIVEQFDSDGKNFAPKPWYSCKMKSNCLPGETDTGEYCVSEGCPAGMERGANIGSEFCYPKCAPGYEADGGGRCYKICPEGYLTQGDNCIRPKHEFKKDAIPCKGCVAPTLPAPMPQIPIVVEEDLGPVWMNPPTISWSSTPTTTTIIAKKRMIEPFNEHVKIKSNLDPSQINSVEMMEDMAKKEMKTKDREDINVPKCKGSGCMKPKGKVVWRVEDRIHVDELPCPLGYTLSGDTCYENCPPNYRDTGNGCVLDRYSVDRPSYDRGSGVPFATKRSKYQNINPVQQCN